MACPACGKELTWIAQYNAWYCYAEQQYRQPAAQGTPAPQPQAVAPPAAAAPPSLWTQGHYRIRKKVLAVAQQYWIEDGNGTALAYSRQKMLRIKEDIRIFSDESMAQELFRIQQQNYTDTWGKFAIIDSATNQVVGFIVRKALSSLVRSQWDLFDAWERPIGGIHEETGRALARRFIPGGGLVPDKVTVSLNGQPVATIDQQFKLIGDIWDINAQWAPPHLDRRVLLSTALLMGMIERQQQR